MKWTTIRYCRKSNRSSDEDAGWDCCLEANSACNPPCLRVLARFLLLAFSEVLLGAVGACNWAAVSFAGFVVVVDWSNVEVEALGALECSGSLRCGLIARRWQRKHW